MGASRPSQFPPDVGVEVAFAGRSNSGKSSAINTVTGRTSLARVSKTPGRTRQINFFRLDSTRHLVDLPGYGYARVPEPVKREWGQLVERYLRERRSLRGVVLVMDARRAFTDLDRVLLQWCADSDVLALALLTKADKLKRASQVAALAQARRVLAEHATGGEALLFSATRRVGLCAVHSHLDTWFASGL